MIGLLVIGIIVTIAGLYMTQTSDGSQGKDSGRFRGRVATIIGVIVIVISIIIGSFTTIPAGHRGVVIRFSAVTGSILHEGLQMKLPFLDSVVKMSVQTEKYETGAASASRDLQDVNTTIALNWRLDPSMAAEVYRTLGMDFIDRIAAPAVQETIKQVTAKYIAEDLILKREMVKNEIQENLSNRLLQRGIITETVSITEFQFSATFVAAIEAKVAAEQAVWEARNKLDRVKVEADQREAEAKGEAAARIAKAEGESEYIRIVTDAQVAANDAVAESLTPQVLQYILLDRLGEDIKIIVIPSGQGLDLVLPEINPELSVVNQP
jgi:regulator of protease activity HflC (stomatin/prohibitin superfamily)|tara:strand:- start:181 stop:1149 length:969 start_codon:yes stop_codon:yes gene_type:complete